MNLDEHAPLGWSPDGELMAQMRLVEANRRMEAGRPDLALVEAELLLVRAPEQPEALRISAMSALAMGDGGMAAVALEALLAGEGEPRLWALLSTAHLLMGDFPGALGAAEKAVQLAPQEADSFLTKGFALERLGHPGHAKKAFAEAEVLKPGCSPVADAKPPSEWNQAFRAALGRLPASLQGLVRGLKLRWRQFPPSEIEGAPSELNPFMDALILGEDGEAPGELFLFKGNLGRPQVDAEGLTERIERALARAALEHLARAEEEALEESIEELLGGD
jgi:tetratricopeptide (TPR) repeat protein